MFEHATLHGLPQRLWQAAFFLDMAKHGTNCEPSSEVSAMAERLSRQCDEVVVWRKKKLGW